MKKEIIHKPRDKTLISFLFFSILVVIGMSIGYSALNEELGISGDAYVRVESDIRVTDIKLVEATNGAFETYNSQYSKDTTSMFVTLPNTTSTITYEVEIRNNSDNEYHILKILDEVFSNKNFKYEILTDLEESIGSLSTKTILIKVSCVASSSNQSGNIVLKYVFNEEEVVPPTIIGGNELWSSTERVISISIPGFAKSGVAHYEYYISNSIEIPDSLVIPTGITQDDVTISSEGISYIWYRTISKNDFKSKWSNVQVVKIDKTMPTLTMIGPIKDVTKDPTFVNTWNGISPYNNLGNGNLIITKESMSTNFGISNALIITVNDVVFPGLGGFIQLQDPASLGDIYIHTFIAKIPIGYYLWPSSNYLGENSKLYWLTDNKGNGEWKEYSYVIQIGDKLEDGRLLGNFGHVYLLAESSINYPVKWYISYSNIYKRELSSGGNNFWFTFNDNNSVDSYQITSSNTTPTDWIKVTELGVNYTQNKTGTYYFWIKDIAGNIVSKNFTVS